MRRFLAATATATALAIGGAIAAAAPSGAGVSIVVPVDTIYGLTSAGNLVQFSAAAPTVLTDSDPITGLVGGDTLVGMDFRPATGELIALGSGSRLYRIDLATAAATVIGSSGAFTLNGASFGVDFNPVPDRLRVTSDTEQNLRLNPNDGSLSGTDTALAYAAGDPNFGANPTVAASAYTNSVDCTATTTLFNIDTALDIVVRQGGVNVPPGTPSPNGGALFTVGPLGLDAGAVAGFDISNATSVAYAALQVGGVASLYTVNLATGAATLVGAIGVGTTPIVDIAVQQGGINPSAYSISDAANGEGDANGPFAFNLTRTAGASVPVTVNVTSADVSASAPGDYTALSATNLTFPAGCTVLSAPQAGSVIGDDLVENDETFTVTINSVSPTSATIADGSATMTILDDDFPGSRPAVVRNGNAWFLRNSLTTGVADSSFGFGNPGDQALFCDGDGNGTSTPAVFRNGAWFLRNSNSTGAADVTFAFGAAGDVPVCGDWDGDGDETPGVRRGNQFLLRNSNSNGAVDIVVSYGNGGDVPIVGDWDGNGTDTVGVVRGIGWFLRNSNTSGVADSSFGYGSLGDVPVVGDWDGDGDDTAGVVRGGNWFLRNGAAGGNADVPSFSYGNPGDPARSFKVVGTA